MLFTILKSQSHTRLNQPKNFPKSYKHKQTHPFTILSDFHHGSTTHSRKQREKRKREHDAKNGKQQKPQENGKCERKSNQTQTKRQGKKS